MLANTEENHVNDNLLSLCKTYNERTRSRDRLQPVFSFVAAPHCQCEILAVIEKQHLFHCSRLKTIHKWMCIRSNSQSTVNEIKKMPWQHGGIREKMTWIYRLLWPSSARYLLKNYYSPGFRLCFLFKKRICRGSIFLGWWGSYVLLKSFLDDVTDLFSI